MTYTLIVYFMLSFGPNAGLYQRSETHVADFATCNQLEAAINYQSDNPHDRSPHYAICRAYAA